MPAWYAARGRPLARRRICGRRCVRDTCGQNEVDHLSARICQGTLSVPAGTLLVSAWKASSRAVTASAAAKWS